MIRLFKNTSNIYMGLWSLYLMQGTLYPKGSLISQAFLLLILLLSLKAMIEVNRLTTVPLYFKGLNVMVAMFTFYGILLFLTDGSSVRRIGGSTVQSMTYLKNAYLSLLPIYVSYLYSKKGMLTLNNMQIWAVIFLFVAILDFREQQQTALLAAIARGSSREEFTNNAGYIMMSLLPMMMVFNKRAIIQFVGIGVCVFYVIVGMKRGAALITAVALMQFIFYKLRSTSNQKKILILVCVGIAFFYLVHFVQELMLNSDLFNSRIQSTLEGESSHRDVLYSVFWNHFVYNSNFFEMIFGGGAYNTIKISFNYAHNDWLEILTNNGLFGVSLFASYWILFYKSIKNNQLCDESSLCLQLCFTIYFLKTLFSMSITSMSIYATCIIGFAFANGFQQLNKTDNIYNE